MGVMKARVFPALLLTVMIAGCSAVRDARRTGSADPAAEARLGEAFTGKSYGVAGLLRTVERRSVFSQDTAAYLYLHILDARAGETLIACTLYRGDDHVKTIRRIAPENGSAIMFLQLTIAGCRGCPGDYTVEIFLDGRPARILSFSILPGMDKNEPEGDAPAAPALTLAAPPLTLATPAPALAVPPCEHCAGGRPGGVDLSPRILSFSDSGLIF